MKSNRALASITPRKVWLMVFSLWVLFLTGALAQWGSPGVIQMARLRDLLELKQDQLGQLRGEIGRLESDAVLLEKSKMIQQREIRRVLGYAAPDEIIFDFTPTERIRQ